MSKYVSPGLYRPYLQPTSGLGQAGRTTGAIILGGPRAGAGSSVRIYNFYNGLPAKIKDPWMASVRANAQKLFTNNVPSKYSFLNFA
jgi:hypothetical protein